MQCYQYNFYDLMNFVLTNDEFINMCKGLDKSVYETLFCLKEALLNLNHDDPEFKDKDEEYKNLKCTLPKFCHVSCSFLDNKRKQENAILNGLRMADVDGIKGMTPEEYWAQKVKMFADRGQDIYEVLGIKYVKKSCGGHGLQIFATSVMGMTPQENMMDLYEQLEIEPELRDLKVFNADRLSFAVRPEYNIYLADDFITYEDKAYQQAYSPALNGGMVPVLPTPVVPAVAASGQQTETVELAEGDSQEKPMLGSIPYEEFVNEWVSKVLGGKEPLVGERNNTYFEMAKDFAHITDYNFNLLLQILPSFGLSAEERNRTIMNAIKHRTQMRRQMKLVLDAVRNRHIDEEELSDELEELDDQISRNDMSNVRLSKAMKASCDGLEPNMWMVVLGLVTAVVGFLATRVRLAIHGKFFHLNNVHFIVGEAGSNKGEMDELEQLWLEDIYAQEDIFSQLEEKWEEDKRMATNKKEQPKELHLKRRVFSLRSSIAKILERMKEIRGMHGWSFSAEAEILAQSFKAAFSDLSILIRKSFDNTDYDNDFKSVNSTNCKIKHVMWNIVACCTPNILPKLFRDTVNGAIHRVGIFTTPDNTFARFKMTKPRSEKSKADIRRVAGLLPLFQGDVTLNRLEDRNQEWLEVIRRATAKENDRVKARMRIRIPHMAMRMCCEMMLTELAQWLYEQIDLKEKRADWTDGCTTAAQYLQTHPEAAAQHLPRFEKKYLDTFDILADYLLENLNHFMAGRIRKAYASEDYITTERKREGKNDNIYDRLPEVFTTSEMAAIAMEVRKGDEEPLTGNALRQMRKNWKKAGLIEPVEDGKYKKLIE